MKILVDSDILIEVMRHRDPSILSAWRNALEDEETLIFCSPVSRCELWAGARPREVSALEELFSALVCPPITDETARLAGHYLEKYAKSHSLAIADALIAAGAAFAGAKLWTNNRKHFPMKDIALYTPPKRQSS